MMRRALAVLLTAALAAPGCATAAGPQFQMAPGVDRTQSDRSLLADYVRKLPVGSRVRVHLTDGRRERGTLMDATSERLVIQPRTRIPEPPIQIALDRVMAVELEHSNGSVGRAVGIGIAAGVGAVLGFFLLLAAVYAD